MTSRPIFARFYQWASPQMDRGGVREHRQRLLAGLSGRVIEIGAGNGLNFPHYPPEVTEVIAVEPEPHLREAARRNAADAPVRVEVVAGEAGRLPVDEASCDAAVFCLVLCSVPDQGTALLEARRVLRPGGQLRFFEHVRAPGAAMRRVQTIADATVWPLLCGGCHLGRDTAAAISAAGFDITELQRLRFPESPAFLPSSPHILGAASR